MFIIKLVIIFTHIVFFFILYKLYFKYEKHFFKKYASVLISFFIIQITINIFLNKFPPIKKIFINNNFKFIGQYNSFMLSCAFAAVINIIFVIIVQKIKEKKFIKSEENKYKIEKFEYYRDIIGNIPPALIYYIYRMKLNYNDQIVASIIYLKEKKIIKIEDNAVKLIDEQTKISKHEQLIIDFLKNKIYESKFKKKFKNTLLEDMKEGSYIKDKNFEYNATEPMQIIIIWVILSTITLLPYSLISLIGYAIVFISIPFYKLIESKINPIVRTEKSLILSAKMNGMKKFLKDFSIMNNRDIEEIKLYDDYLLYSILFNFKGKLDQDSKKMYKNLTCNLKKEKKFSFSNLSSEEKMSFIVSIIILAIFAIFTITLDLLYITIPLIIIFLIPIIGSLYKP